jgi:VanZ family protein
MGFIFYLSGRPGLKVAEGTADFLSRKLAHIGEYAALYLLLLRALKRSFSWEASLPLFLVAGTFSFLYAVSDELHQSFVPLREGKVGDLFFDLLGILAGFLAVRFGLLKCLGFGE